MMLRMRTTSLLIGLLLLLPAFAAAQRLSVPGRTPESAFAVLSVSDMKTIWSNLSRSPLRRAVGAITEIAPQAGPPEWLRFQQQRPAIENAIGFSLNPDLLFAAVIRGGDLYFLRPAISGDPVAWCLLLNFNDEDYASAVRARLEKEAADAGLTHTETPVGSWRIRSIPEENLHIASFGTVLILGSTERAAREVLDAKDNAELTTSGKFKEVMSQFQTTSPQCWGFINLKDFSTIGQRMGMLEAATAARLAGEGYYAFVGEFQQAYMKFTTFSPTPESGPTAAQTAGMASTAIRAAFFLPDNALVVHSTASFSLREALARPGLSDAIDTIAGPELFPQLTASADAFGSDLGFSISSVTPNLSSPIPVLVDACVVLSVADATAARPVIDRVETLLSSLIGRSSENLFQDSTVAGLGARTLVLPNVPASALSLTWAITADNMLVVTTLRNSLEAALNRGLGGQGSLAQSRSLNQASTFLRRNRQGIGIVAIAEIIRNAMPVFQGFAPMAGFGGEQTEAIVALSELLLPLGAMYSTDSWIREGHIREYLIMMQAN